MKQADVRKHIKAGTALAVMGQVSSTPSRRTGKFALGSPERQTEPVKHTKAVAVSLAPATVKMLSGGDWPRMLEQTVPCVTVRLEDGSAGLVLPRTISGTWDDYEAFVSEWEAQADAKRGAFERQLAAAGVLGGRARDGGVFLSLERAEELAAEIGSGVPSNHE